MQCAKVCPTGALTPSGYRLSPQELVSRLMRDLPFYGNSGGVTFSGGEPLLYPRYIAACARLLHVPTRYIDTCGAVPQKHIYFIKPYTDLLLFDIKDTDGERLLRNTGADLDIILRNLEYADDLGIPTRLRLPIIAGINDNEVHMRAVRNLLRRLRHCIGADILPYHPYMASKYHALGLVCGILSDSYIPKTETLARLREILDN